MSDSPSQHGIEAEEWAGRMGQTWLDHLTAFEGMISPIGAALMAHADFKPGERVVDIGSGGGDSSIAIARRVGPEGSVLGIDISPVLVEASDKRAREAGLANVRFMAADASTAKSDAAPFDRLHSRFGVMFFEDMDKAFANLHGLIRPGGRADMAVWAPASDNGWIALMMQIVARHVEMPPAVPRAPGPFALAETDYLTGILERAGFKDISITRWQGDQLVGGIGATPRAAARFVLDAMAFGAALKEKPAAVREQVEEELTALFDQHHGPNGVAMPASAWLATALA